MMKSLGFDYYYNDYGWAYIMCCNFRHIFNLTVNKGNDAHWTSFDHELSHDSIKTD